MFVLDVETLSVWTDAVILSLGMVYVPDATPRSYEELLDSGILVKFDAKYQVESLNRRVDKDTLGWWMKQAPAVRDYSFKKSDKDLKPLQAFELIHEWISKTKQSKSDICWVRGFMDPIVTENLAKQINIKPLFYHSEYRDIRTAMDLLYPETSKGGYVDVDTDLCRGFSIEKVVKHHPLHDCAYDAAMLLYGKGSK